MGEFNGKISAEFSPPKTWVLNRELSFTTDQFSAADIEVLERVGANITKSGKFSCLNDRCIRSCFCAGLFFRA